ncbi:hypothetical protein QX201_000068 [Fusarium graminearum]
MPPPRSANTCTQCRVRKVRCDGGPESCSNCERLGFSCAFGTTSPSHPERRRGSRACVQCRSQKTRCSGELPTCASCRLRDKDCLYPDNRRSSRASKRSPSISNQSAHSAAESSPIPSRLHQTSPSNLSTGDGSFTLLYNESALPAVSNHLPEPSPQQSTSWRGSVSDPIPNQVGDGNRSMPLPPMRDRLQLVTDFFRHIYPLPSYAFLNEVSITQRCLDGSLDETLLLAICAISSFHLQYSKYHPASTLAWIQRAEDIIWSRIEQPTIFRTQALLLIVHYRIDTGSFQRAYMLFGIAGRAASALRLQYERIDLGPVAQEIRRRMMWCMMLINCRFSIGLPESEVCSPDLIYLKMPCGEEQFHADNDSVVGDDPSTLDGISENGLLATHISETMILRDIMRLTRQVRLSSQPMPQLPDLVDEFVKMLQQLQVPPYSYEELKRYASSRWLTRYLTVHLTWHQTHCDAYRLFLSGYREAASEAVLASCSPAHITAGARFCLHHARANITILKDFSMLGDVLRLSHHTVAICAYHACRLILFLSSSPLIPSESNLTPQEACNQASQILELLKRLYKHSAVEQHIIKDLESLIQLQMAGKTDDRQESPEQGNGDSQQPRFAVTVRKHKSLGVHSVLRRAGFDDDSAEAGVPPGQALPQVQSSVTGPELLRGSHEMETRQPEIGSTSDGHLALDILMQAAMGPSPGPPLTNIPIEPFSLGPWDALNEWPYQGNFSPRSDADYF